MSKITLASVASIDNSLISAVNNNNAILTTAMDNTLSRDGTTPNQMGSNLDMNNNQIVNLPPPATINSPARLVDVTSPAQIASVPPVGTSGAVVGLLNGNNTTSGNNIHSGTETFNGNVTISSGLSVATSNTITRANLTQGSARTVIGVTGNATANVADIQGTTRQVLAVNTAGTALVFAQPQGDQLLGTITNDNASAGNLGEYVSSSIASGSAVALTTTVQTNIVSISLTAGDWDVSSTAYFLPSGTTNITNLSSSISTTSASMNGNPGFIAQFQQAAAVPGAASISSSIPMVRFSLASTTTVFLVVQPVFTVSTLSGYGIIQARRVR